MLPSDCPDQQYVVSLDSLDLSLLSQYVQKPADQKRVLWSKPSMDGESVYCKVHIQPDELQDENAYIETSEVYLCHICNIDVPRAYLKQHNKSRSHQNYKKLTEKVLENVLKQFNIDIDSNDNFGQHDKYYCETCSKVVLTKHKRQHNRSKYHSNSIENQRQADNFIEIYVKNKEDENRNVVNKTRSNRNAIENNSSSDTDWNFDSDTEDETVTNVTEVFQINNVSHKSIQTPIKKTECSTSNGLSTSQEIKDFQLYLKEMIAKYNLKFNLPPVEDNSIVIVTPKGYKEKISIDTFHGFKRVNHFIYCQLCWVSVHQGISEHSKSKEHVMQVIQPVGDDFIRSLSILKEGWGHCLICNLTVNCATHVALSANHQKYNKANTSIENLKPAVINNIIPKTTFCDVCKIDIDTHNFNGHVNAKKHKNKLKQVADNPSPVASGSNTPLTNTTAPPSQSVVQNKININYCDLCKVNVPPGGMAIHEAGRPHKTKVTAEIKSALNQLKSEISKLTVADKKITLKSDIPSTSKANPGSPVKNTVKALTKEEKLLIYRNQICASSPTEATCLVCNLKVPNLDNKIIEHVESAKHTIATEVLLNKNQITKTSLMFYYCKLCKVTFSIFIRHVKDVDHNAKMILSSEPINKIDLRKYVYEEPLNVDNLALANRIVYQDLLEKNKIIRLNATSFYCAVCSVNLSRINEIDHMLGERHKSMNSNK